MAETQTAVGQIGTRAEFQQVLVNSGDRLVVVNFFAPWCTPCRKMTPEFEKIANRKDFSNVAFFSVDTNENVATAEFYSVNVLPTFILYRKGLKVERFTGADPQKLETFISSHLTNGNC